MDNTMNINEEKEIPSGQQFINYELLAELFLYPENISYKKKIKDTHTYLLQILPKAAEALQPFVDFTEASSIEEIQELFLRSFDLQAITTLDIGFILFGEDYKRGQLLVHLNTEHKNAGNVCYKELSDHLPNVLCLLPKMTDELKRWEIAARLLIPAVVKMISEFSFDKIEKKDQVYKKHQKILLESSKNHRTVYQHTLQAVFIALNNDFRYDPDMDEFSAANSDPQNPQKSGNEKSGANMLNSGEIDFARNIETEMNVEK